VVDDGRLLHVGLIPFAVGFFSVICCGSIPSGPRWVGLTSVFALAGGAYGPLATSGVLLAIVKCLPSYWLVQAVKSALGASGWPPAEAWIVIATWTVVLVWIAERVYRLDTSRV
jgi:hypothetical protein